MATDSRLKRAGVSGFNKPKRTPNHPKKSHVVVAKSGSQVKTIRFGQQGVSGSPKKSGETKSYRQRRQSFKVIVPKDSDLATYDRVLRGGYDNVITDAEAAELTAAGYGDYIWDE